jgi:hypothetical protein
MTKCVPASEAGKRNIVNPMVIKYRKGLKAPIRFGHSKTELVINDNPLIIITEPTALLTFPNDLTKTFPTFTTSCPTVAI